MKNVIYATGFFCIIMSQVACSKGSNSSSFNPATASNEELVQQCVLATKGSVDCNAAVASASTPQGLARLKAIMDNKPAEAEVSSSTSLADLQAKAIQLNANTANASAYQGAIAAQTPSVAATPVTTTIFSVGGSRSPASASSPQSAASVNYQASSVTEPQPSLSGGGGAEGDATR